MGIAFGGCFFVPGVCLGVVLRDTVAVVIEDTEAVLGIGIILGSGFFEPGACLRVVLRDALTFGVKDTEVVLGTGITLGGSLFVPGARLRVVLRHALALAVEGAEVKLGINMILCGGSFPPYSSLSVVLRHTLTEIVESAQFKLGGGVACRCTLLQVGEGAVRCGLFGIGTFLPLSEIGGLLAGRVVCGQGMSSCSEKEGKAEGLVHRVLLGWLGRGSVFFCFSDPLLQFAFFSVAQAVGGGRAATCAPPPGDSGEHCRKWRDPQGEGLAF